jgi:predicted nucleotidyltransferase
MSGVSGGDQHRAMAERTTILRVPAGSNLHGLNVPGTDDSDEVGVCIEDIEAAIGFSEFEQYIYRSAAEREGKHDAPSRAGDLDLTIFSLRKFLRLAMQGNPQSLQCLFVPHALCLQIDARGSQLQELAPLIVSRQAGARYLGYLEAQRQRLLGERGQKKVNRPELEAKFGFDTKYAMHILRLGFQGVELMTTGRLTLPMAEKDRAFVYATRLGAVPLQDVLTRAGELEREIKDLMHDAPIPAEPARDEIQAWMVSMYFQNWQARVPVPAILLEAMAKSESHCDADWLPPSARGAAFLQAHPEVWRDYDGTTAAKQYVFERMQEAGIFAPKTSHHDVNFRWIEAAMRVAD